MKKLFFLFSIVCLFSCSGLNNKKYQYIETVVGDSFDASLKKELEPKEFEESSDSAAFVQAYKYYCISIKVQKDMKEAFGTTTRQPLSFQLLDENGMDITLAASSFSGLADVKKKIEDEIFSMQNNIKDAVDKNKADKEDEFKQTAKVDSTKILELSKYFKIEADEFSNNKTTWYKPKSAPKYTNQNGLYCYFQTENGMPRNLRFRMQYYADDWLFINRVQFSIDDVAYEYVPSDTERDNGDGGYIWEWYDEQLTTSDKSLITALANAKSAKMKLIGSQYFKVKTISKEQIKDIGRSLELYRAMGGSY